MKYNIYLDCAELLDKKSSGTFCTILVVNDTDMEVTEVSRATRKTNIIVYVLPSCMLSKLFEFRRWPGEAFKTGGPTGLGFTSYQSSGFTLFGQQLFFTSLYRFMNPFLLLITLSPFLT